MTSVAAPFPILANDEAGRVKPMDTIARTYLHDITNKAEPRPSQIVWYGTYEANDELVTQFASNVERIKAGG